MAYFAEVGLSGDTRTLARRLGVTQSLIFNYFSTKADLIEAVLSRVHLDRLSPDWAAMMRDRTTPIETRIRRFYRAYASAIFSYEWMRIFMYSGLAGDQLNRRYLGDLRQTILEPMLEELRASHPRFADVTLEDVWALHGGVVYIGIRRFIYLTPTPDDPLAAVDRAVDRFLATTRAGPDGAHPRPPDGR